MSPHVGGSVYTPKRAVDSNRRGFAEQRTRLSPVSNRVDRLDGSAGRVPPPLTMTWVEDISTIANIYFVLLCLSGNGGCAGVTERRQLHIFFALCRWLLLF